jgi:hypothetical protein
LEDVANIEEKTGPNTINREKVKRRIVVQCNVSDRGLVDVVNDIKQRVGGIDLPKGYFVEYGGQFESQASASQTSFLSEDLFFGDGLAPVDIPGVERHTDAPSESDKRRPREPCPRGGEDHAPDRPDDHVDQDVRDQMGVELSLLVEPFHRLFPQVGVWLRNCLLRILHLSYLLVSVSIKTIFRLDDPYVPGPEVTNPRDEKSS